MNESEKRSVGGDPCSGLTMQMPMYVMIPVELCQKTKVQEGDRVDKRLHDVSSFVLLGAIVVHSAPRKVFETLPRI